MKTYKTSLTTTGTPLYLKALIIGTVSGIVSLLVFLCLIAVILLISGTLPHAYIIWFSVATCTVSSFISGYTSARIRKVKGLYTGAVTGIIIFMISLIAGLAVSFDTITYLTPLKFVLFTLSGALGGIKAVNKKEKIHIK